MHTLQDIEDSTNKDPSDQCRCSMKEKIVRKFGN